MARGRKDPKGAVPEAGCLEDGAGIGLPEDLIISETLVPVAVDVPEDPSVPPAPRPRPRYKSSSRDRRVHENVKTLRPADEIDVGLTGGRATTCPR